MREVRSGPWTILLALTLTAALLFVAPVPRAGGAPGSVPGAGGSAHPLASCTGALEGKFVNGTLSEVGNTTPVPHVAGVNLTVQFAQEVTVTPTGQPSTVQCETGSATGTTDVVGHFSIVLAVPVGGCDGRGCTEYTGPYAPERVRLADAAPPGYFLAGSVTSPTSHLTLVAAFDRLAIDPPGPKTVSVGDPVGFSAIAYAADGTPSPATLDPSWSVVGPGWLLSTASGPRTVLTADGDAGPTTLTLVANATYSGHDIAALRTSDALDALATNIDLASATPTRLDAGSAATFVLLGRGSEGYNYTASVGPGNGGPWVSEPCATTLIPGGEVQVACTLQAVYPEAGTYQAAANLTNGYSTGRWMFPTLAVSSALELSLPDAPVLGYVGSTIAITAGVANATGTGPYGPACFDDGLGALQCDSSPGPLWTFYTTYHGTGIYPASVTVRDGSGANVSRPLPVTVGTAPRVEDLAASAASLPMHTADPLEATVEGGVGPVDYWWNSSALPGAFAWGTTTSGTTLGASYWANGTSGPQTITLSVRDGLGTLVAASLAIYVVPGPAVSLAAVGGSPNATLYAGVAARYSLEALTPGPVIGRVPNYAAEVDLTLRSGPVAASALAVESALLGPIAPSAKGTFVLPASAWFAGYLNFTITTDRAGAYDLGLASELPIAFAPHGVLEVLVEAELPALHLVDPVYALGGPRANHTLYRLVDPFGNPAPAGALYVTASFGGVNTTVASPIHANATEAWAWVNFTAPSDAAGVIVVRSGWGEVLLGPIAVPAAPAVLPIVWLSAAALAGVGAVALGVSVMRRRGAGGRAEEVGELTPEELRHEAEGRAALLDRIRTEGPLDLDQLFDGNGPDPPTHAELTEWLASLLTERLVESTMAHDGRPTVRAVERSPQPESPRVEFDPSVLERGAWTPDEPVSALDDDTAPEE